MIQNYSGIETITSELLRLTFKVPNDNKDASES